MKKFKLLTKALSVSTLALTATSVGLFTTSCSNIDSLFFTLKNDKGLEIEFCDTGASIYSIKYNDTYLTYHPKDKSTYLNKSRKTYFHGKTLGRVAGRFADGKFKLDGKEYQVQVNEKSATKNNCLHGGSDSFVYADFKRYVKEDKTNKVTYVAFNYLSPADEAGFPETIDAWIIYTLHHDANILDTTLIAIPTGKTLINLSTHSLFRLGNDGDVLNYQLTINADQRVKYVNESDKDKNGQIPEGLEPTDAHDGIFDFRPEKVAAGKTIKTDMEKSKKYDPVSGGIDHIWYCGEPSRELDDRYVNLYNPSNKINLRVTATSENVTGFILYSNDYPLENTIMTDGKQDTTYAGITIEPYTYFTNDEEGLKSITYTPEHPFYTSYSYEIKTM